MADPKQSLTILLYDDAVDRAHYALVMASAAAAINQEVTVFCAGLAVQLLAEGQPGAPGWHRLGSSRNGMTAPLFDTTAKRRGGAGFDALLEACRDLGVSFICCEFAARMAALKQADLRTDIAIETAGVTTLLSRAGKDGRIVSF